MTGHRRVRLVIAGLSLLAGLAAGCSTDTNGTATPAAEQPTEPTAATSRPSPVPPQTPTPAPSPSAPPPAGDVLAPQNGYVFIQTKSGKTRCQLDEQEVDCESQFANAPLVDGTPANGVRLTADGQQTWTLGNLGAIPAVTLDYTTYSALGWTIVASEDGTRFTNDATGHGMVVAIDGVQVF